MPETGGVLTAADYILVAGFFVLMLAIGVYFAGRVRDMKDYFSGGKQVSWWLSGVSYWMSSFSAFAFVAASAVAYEQGFVAVTMWWNAGATMILAAYLVAARWRRVGTTSPMEFIEERYGPAMRQSLSYLGAILIILDDATKIVAIGIVVSISLGLPTTYAILGCGLIMLTYTLLGGLWAVLITDMVQFVVMLAAVIVLVPLALARAGGIAGFTENVPDGFLALTGDKYTVTFVFVYAILQALSLFTRWSLVQRFYAVPTDADARKVCFLAAALYMIGAPLIFFPAMAASIYLPGVENPDEIYGLLCRELLPVGMLGMLVAGIFSATMSSLSSDYNAVASVLTTDVYKRLLVRTASDRHCVVIGRISTLIVGLVTMGIALKMSQMMAAGTSGKLLFDLMVSIFSLLGPPTMIPVVCGLLFRRVSNAGALLGVATGVTVGFIFRFGGAAILDLLEPLLAPWLGYTPVVEEIPETVFMVTSIVSTSVGLILGSLIWPGSRDSQDRVDRFLRGMTAREVVPAAAPVSDRSTVSPLPIVGLAVAILGALLLAVTFAMTSIHQSKCSLVVGTSMLALGCGMIGLPRLLRSKTG